MTRKEVSKMIHSLILYVLFVNFVSMNHCIVLFNSACRVNRGIRDNVMILSLLSSLRCFEWTRVCDISSSSSSSMRFILSLF